MGYKVEIPQTNRFSLSYSHGYVHKGAPAKGVPLLVYEREPRFLYEREPRFPLMALFPAGWDLSKASPGHVRRARGVTGGQPGEAGPTGHAVWQPMMEM